MANTPDKAGAAKAQPDAGQNTPRFSMTKEEKLALAKRIALRDKKWGSDQAKLFLAKVLLAHGVPQASLDPLLNDLDFNGAVINCSQFAQWADGTPKEPDRLGLGFALRQSEAKRASILASLEGI